MMEIVVRDGMGGFTKWGLSDIKHKLKILVIGLFYLVGLAGQKMIVAIQTHSTLFFAQY